MNDKLKKNVISERINRIENMLKGKTIDSIVDFNDNSFMNHNNIKLSNDSESSVLSDDIRELVPKKYIDFVKAINQIGGKLLYIKSGSTGHTFKGIFPSNKLFNDW